VSGKGRRKSEWERGDERMSGRGRRKCGKEKSLKKLKIIYCM
jgi:hypothetical protein